jgi:UDP-N-acetylmuramoyl-tripeptide--D-alanyl-D-alanine ligase
MQVFLPQIEKTASSWSIDTRTLQQGDVFFALNNGYQFTATALEKGALAAIVDRDVTPAPGIIRVPDALVYLQELAQTARTDWAGTVIGVTGSAGKTSTKDAIAHLLSAEGALGKTVGKTVGNFNNHIGVPLSILRLPQTSRVAVLEMGMNHAGEIRALCEIARPDIGVVTNVGFAHVEFFDSIEGIALAKRELIEALPPAGTAILNADDERVARFGEVHPGRSVSYGFSESAAIRAELVDSNHFRCQGVEFETQLSGRHAISNILAGIAVAAIFGISARHLVDPVQSLVPTHMRGERLEHNGITILNDSYNSNPAAVRAMLDVLADTPARRRIAVLGEMLELGNATEPLHRDLGKYVAERGIDVLITIRGAARFMAEQAGKAGMSGSAAYFFETPEEAGTFLQQFATPGDAILFKGSRGVKVERALHALLEPAAQPPVQPEAINI